MAIRFAARSVSLGALLSIIAAGAAHADTKVSVLRTPDGGIQPQAVVDDKGTLHLLYFKGDAGAGDLFYFKRAAGADRFSKAIRVNSQPASAIATGTIRGGQIALGKAGRVHVAWNGSGKAKPQSQGKYTAPMLYARQSDQGTAFEEQRNLMQNSTTLDGGGTVAADADGNVYVAWHAVLLGGPMGEENRKVWLARSTDEGKTFAEEAAVNPKPTGACGCCAMRGFVDRKGSLYLFYRSAKGGSRDMYLLTSTEAGKKFQTALAHPWFIGACPMSSMAFAEGPGGIVGAWETEEQIYFATIKPGTTECTAPRSPPGAGKSRKHPAIAVSTSGDTLVVWAEGTGWQRGGDLAWQVFDKSGKATEQRGCVERGIPVWGLPTAVATTEGFVIIH
jgi:hypothetical protein